MCVKIYVAFDYQIPIYMSKVSLQITDRRGKTIALLLLLLNKLRIFGILKKTRWNVFLSA